MPRFTLFQINLNDRREHRNMQLLAERIQQRRFIHRNDIDFATEREVWDAQLYWCVDPNTPRVIATYEPLPNNQLRILGFTHYMNSEPGDLHYDFQEPITLPTIPYNQPLWNQNNMAFVPGQLRPNPPPENNGVRPNPPPVNNGQSTHTHSVHKSVTESVKKLDIRYGKRLNTEKNITEIKAFTYQITASNFPDITKIQREAAQRFIAGLDGISHEKEAGSGQSLRYILALLWQALHDKEDVLKVDSKTAQSKFIKHLYEIQRGYNLDDKGKDLGGGDQPICIGGTINKLVDSLNGGLHEDVSIAFVNPETAGAKLHAIIRANTVKFILQSDDKNKWIKALDKLKNPEGLYGIPDEILNAIKVRVKQIFDEEFTGLINAKTLNTIFEQYEYVSLLPRDYEKITKNDKKDGNTSQKMTGINIERLESVLKLKKAIAELRIYGAKINQQDKGQAAICLADELDRHLNDFIALVKEEGLPQNNYDNFANKFRTTLHAKDETFARHRHYHRVVIANIAIALTGLGTLILIAKLLDSHAKTGQAVGFFSQTRSMRKVDEIDEKISHLSSLTL